LVITPKTLSLITTLKSVTFPQFVTKPLITWNCPATAVVQFFVTEMHGASVTRQVLVAEAAMRVPHTLVAVAVTTFVFPPQTAVKLFV
jgi:hypothetical protein